MPTTPAEKSPEAKTLDLDDATSSKIGSNFPVTIKLSFGNLSGVDVVAIKKRKLKNGMTRFYLQKQVT